MSRKRHRIENQRIRLSTIVERLPLYRFLDQSQAVLLKLQPAWEAWLQQELPAIDTTSAHLSGFSEAENNGHNTITISANNASTVTLLKHQQSSLLKHLNRSCNGLTIHKIKVRIDLDSTSAVADHQHQISKAAHDEQRTKPSADAIESIKRLQKSIKNPDLADSLGNLAETLQSVSNIGDKTPK